MNGGSVRCAVCNSVTYTTSTKKALLAKLFKRFRRCPAHDNVRFIV